MDAPPADRWQYARTIADQGHDGNPLRAEQQHMTCRDDSPTRNDLLGNRVASTQPEKQARQTASPPKRQTKLQPDRTSEDSLGRKELIFQISLETIWNSLPKYKIRNIIRNEQLRRRHTSCSITPQDHLARWSTKLDREQHKGFSELNQATPCPHGQ